MRDIHLYYLSNNTTGGWVTYTSHLYYGLKELGLNPLIRKIRPRTESKLRNFGYSCEYQNVSLDTALKDCSKTPSIIVAANKGFRNEVKALDEKNCWVVIHDPTEFKTFELNSYERAITIRKSIHKVLEGSHLVIHPYKRRFPFGVPLSEKSSTACSICRIDFDKNTDLILEANRLLDEEKKVSIHGFENRLYSKFKLCPRFPEWKQSVSAYPREKSCAADICKSHVYAVDLSTIKGDGGGTQYSFLEAMDAGCINVIHSKWIQPEDEMIPSPSKGANCITVSSPSELAALLRTPVSKSLQLQIRESSEKLLKRHSCRNVAKSFLSLLKAK